MSKNKFIILAVINLLYAIYFLLISNETPNLVLFVIFLFISGYFVLLNRESFRKIRFVFYSLSMFLHLIISIVTLLFLIAGSSENLFYGPLFVLSNIVIYELLRNHLIFESINKSIKKFIYHFLIFISVSASAIILLYTLDYIVYEAGNKQIDELAIEIKNYADSTGYDRFALINYESEKELTIQEFVASTFSYHPVWVKSFFKTFNALVVIFSSDIDISIDEYNDRQFITIKPDEIPMTIGGKMPGEDGPVMFTDKENYWIVGDEGLIRKNKRGVIWGIVKENKTSGKTNYKLICLVKDNGDTVGRIFYDLFCPFHNAILQSMGNGGIKKYNKKDSEFWH